jgi:hypothetical protein
MRRIISLSLIMVMAGSVVWAVSPDSMSAVKSDNGAQNQGAMQVDGNAQPAGEQVQTQQQTQNQGEETQVTTQERNQERIQIQDAESLRQNVQQRAQEMAQEAQNLGERQAEVYQNQNKVRLAVHSFLAMEDLVGGIGQQVSEIATEFDNSVQATIRAEEKIQNRNQFVRFFMGGDMEAAAAIEEEVNNNRERIQQLQQLREQCDCDEEVKSVFQEQIQNMEQEQNRLQQLANQEQQHSGLFGWFFRLFQR